MNSVQSFDVLSNSTDSLLDITKTNVSCSSDALDILNSTNNTINSNDQDRSEDVSESKSEVIDDTSLFSDIKSIGLLINSNNVSVDGFFYIIQTSDVTDSVYKIGKTEDMDLNRKLCIYPVYSCVKYTVYCENIDLFYNMVVHKFSTTFKKKLEYGQNYYFGDLKNMVDCCHKLWMTYGNETKKIYNEEIGKIKPYGWDYFSNEWLINNLDKSNDESYNVYLNIIKNTFGSNEYAEKEIFDKYMDLMR